MATFAVLYQALEFVHRVIPYETASEGESYDETGYDAACCLVQGFGLTEQEALQVLADWNRGRTVPIDPKRLARLVRDAMHYTEENERAPGYLIRPDKRVVVVKVAPEATTIYVGEGVEHSGEENYVDLSPGLWAGYHKAGRNRKVLDQLLDAEVKPGRHIILCPASTIATNGNEIWAEYALAKLIRKKGATVQSVRLPPLGVRRRTMAQAERPLTIVAPPANAGQAAEARERAREELARVSAERRAAPRRSRGRRRSQNMRCALGFLRMEKPEKLDAKVKEHFEACERGCSWRTLQRAFRIWKAEKAAAQPAA